ncbi:MAG: preprotein translocase subunit SecG [Bacteroidales bacterium]
MNAIFTILTILIIVASILLTIVVLLQNGKGDGLASNFVAGNQTFGVRQTADMLERISWGLVTFILVVSIITSFTLGGSKGAGVDVSDQIENAAASEQPAFPTAPAQQAPAQEAPAQEAPATPAK